MKKEKEKLELGKIFGRGKIKQMRGKMPFKGSCQSNSLKDSGNNSDKEQRDEEGKTEIDGNRSKWINTSKRSRQ
jgi:hypothetical protein